MSNDYNSIWLELYRIPHTLGYVNAKGVRTRYLEVGFDNKEVIVLLHGTAGSLENFSLNYNALSEKYRVIGIDMIGCGATDKPDYGYKISDYVKHVKDTLDELGIQRAKFIGVSLGSWIAAALAKAFPALVEKIVMVAPAGIVRDSKAKEEWDVFLEGVRERRMAAVTTPNWDSVKKIMSRLVLHPETLIQDIIAVRLDIYKYPELQRGMPNLLAYAFCEPMSHEDWRSLECDILAIAGVDAPNLFLDNAYAIGDIVQGSKVVELKECDHWAQFEVPVEFNKVVFDFFK